MLLSSWAARRCASSRLNACGGRTANPPCPVAALAQGMLSKTPQLQELAPLNCMHLWQHDIWRSSLQGSQHKVTCSMPAGCQGGQGGGGSQAAAHRKCCAAEGSPEGGPVLPAVLSWEWPVPFSNLSWGPRPKSVCQAAEVSCATLMWLSFTTLNAICLAPSCSPPLLWCICSVASELACLFLLCPGHLQHDAGCSTCRLNPFIEP